MNLFVKFYLSIFIFCQKFLMAKVLSDTYFSRVSSAAQKQPQDINEIVSALQSFRSQMSMKWMDQFLENDPVQSLVETWKLLFSLCDHKEPIVRLNSYSCLGAIIVTIAPLYPKFVSGSFSQAVLCIEVSPNVSIAVISAFTYLIHFIAPYEVGNFILNTPVLHHFGIDVSQYIQHLPHIVELMGPLEKQFHQALLRSLLISFGRNPNHAFVEVANILISMNPKILIHDTIEFSRSNNLKQIILALGPEILQNPVIYNEIVENNYLEDFLTTSLSVLESDQYNLTDFERASSTLVLIARNSPDHLNQIQEATQKLNVPKHLKKFYVLLPVPLSELIPEPNESSTLTCAKLKGFKDFLIRNNTLENVKKVVEIFVSMSKNSSGDVFCAFCESFGDLFNLIYEYEETKNDISLILDTIFEIKNINWVQQDAIVKLLSRLNVNQAAAIVDRYVNKAQAFLLDCCFSSQESLSQNSIKVLTNFATLLTIPQIMANIYKYDFFNIDIALKIIRLVNSLLIEFGPSKPLVDFTSMVEDLIMLFEDTKISSEGFDFLSSIRHEPKNPLILTRAADWLNAIFLSFTQKELVMAFEFNRIEVPNYLTQVETDLVANVLPNTKQAVPGIISTFRYMINTKMINMKVISQFAVQILKLFPHDITYLCMQKLDTSSQEFLHLSMGVLKIMNWCSSIEAAAACCDFLVQSPKIIIDGASQNAQAILESGRVSSGDHLFRLYRIINMFQRDLADELAVKYKGFLSNGEKVLFDLKQGKKDEIVDFVSKENFEDVNIADLDLQNYLSGVENKNFLHVKDFTCLSNTHWKYIAKNSSQFDDDVRKYIKEHPYQMNHYIDNVDPPKVFVYTQEKGSKISSLAPRLLNGTFQFNAPLLTNFFKYSFIKIKEDIIGPILYEALRKVDQPGVSDLCAFIIEYCNKNKINIPESAVLSLLPVENSKLMKNIIRLSIDAEYKDKIRDKAFEILNLSQDNSLLNSLEFGTAVKLIDIAFFLVSDSQFTSFLSQNGTSKKSIILITKALQRYEVSNNSLQSICNFIIENLEVLGEKPKKLQRAMRLLRIAVSRLSDSKASDKKSILEGIAEKLEKLTIVNTSDCVVHNEIAGIFNELMKCVVPTQNTISFIDKTDTTLGNHSPYLPDIFTIFCLGQQLNRASRYVLTQLFESPLRSEQVLALRVCLSLVSKTANALAYNLFSSVLTNFLKAITISPESEAIFWPFPEISSVIIRRCISHPKFNEFKDNFLKSVINSVLPNPNLAALSSLSVAFGDVILCMPPPLPTAAEYAEKFARYNCQSPHFASIFKPFCAWQLKYAQTEEDSANIWLEAVNSNQKAFIARPCLQTAIELADSVAARFDSEESAFLLVGKLALLQNPFIWTYLCIAMYLRRSEDNAGESIIRLATDVADAMPSKERFEAIKHLCEGRIMKGALIASNC